MSERAIEMINLLGPPLLMFGVTIGVSIYFSRKRELAAFESCKKYCETNAARVLVVLKKQAHEAHSLPGLYMLLENEIKFTKHHHPYVLNVEYSFRKLMAEIFANKFFLVRVEKETKIRAIPMEDIERIEIQPVTRNSIHSPWGPPREHMDWTETTVQSLGY